MAWEQLETYNGIHCSIVNESVWNRVIPTGEASFTINNDDWEYWGTNLLDIIFDRSDLRFGIEIEEDYEFDIPVTSLLYIRVKLRPSRPPQTIQLFRVWNEGYQRYDYHVNAGDRGVSTSTNPQGILEVRLVYKDANSELLVGASMGHSEMVFSGYSGNRLAYFLGNEYWEEGYNNREYGTSLMLGLQALRNNETNQFIFNLVYRYVPYNIPDDYAMGTTFMISHKGFYSTSSWIDKREQNYTWYLRDSGYNPPSPPDPPETYDFSPVSHFKGNKTFFQMTMIKETFTNGGEPLNSVQSTAFERLLAHDDLESLTHGIATGTERIFSYTDDDNYVGIVRDSVDSHNDTTTYTINFYTDGVFTNFVTYLCNNSNKYHFSFLIDKGHEVARPSIIREYPSPTNPSLSLFDLNKESDIYITDEHMAEWYTWLSTSTDTEIPDPYSFGGDSETTPSTSGNYDRGSDNVGVPSLPSFNASSLGFFRAYIGNAENYDTISDLSDYLWSNGFDLDTFKKLLANPIQAILSIHLIPLAVTSTELGHSVHLGNVDTGLNMQPVASQFIELDCGTLKVSEYFGSYLDYSPYTRLSLFLPFIGVVPLGIDEIMGKTIGVKYHIDVYTGACVAFVTADGKVLYHFSGMCAINVPITSADASNIASSIISIGSTVATVVATVATGGATAPLIVPAVANTASNVLAGKANIQRSGSLSSNIGFMDNPTPYLILEIPEQCHPEDLNKFKGYPTHATFTLGALKGYTEIEEVHLENMTCTAREAQEIETLLKGGVIL